MITTFPNEVFEATNLVSKRKFQGTWEELKDLDKRVWNVIRVSNKYERPTEGISPSYP